MKAQIIGAVISHLLWIIFCTSNIVRSSTDAKTQSCKHAYLTEDPLGIVFDVALYSTMQLQLPTYIIAYTIIVAKSSQDILQGISKLDYLMVVSIF